MGRDKLRELQKNDQRQFSELQKILKTNSMDFKEMPKDN